MQRVSQAVATTLRLMQAYAQPGMSTLELDEYGGSQLAQWGAKPAPNLAYGFPAHTCISINYEVAHGIPKQEKIMREGDLINIDVSAALNGYWADNGASFVLGTDLHNHQPLVDASRNILQTALAHIKGGVRISAVGKLIENAARRQGFNVIRNLVGHGVGRSLHEHPTEIPCFYDSSNRTRFARNTVVAVETFISTGAGYAYPTADGWTLTTRDGSYVAQHEHTILITDNEPVILTTGNGI